MSALVAITEFPSGPATTSQCLPMLQTFDATGTRPAGTDGRTRPAPTQTASAVRPRPPSQMPEIRYGRIIRTWPRSFGRSDDVGGPSARRRQNLRTFVVKAPASPSSDTVRSGRRSTTLGLTRVRSCIFVPHKRRSVSKPLRLPWARHWKQGVRNRARRARVGSKVEAPIPESRPRRCTTVVRRRLGASPVRGSCDFPATVE